jgi:tellurite resistance protein TerC
MVASGLVWGLTVVLIVGLLLFDFFFHVRNAHAPSLREAALWSSAYIAVALLFGGAVCFYGGAEAGTEYFAGYVTEKALSIDNVFVFLVLMTSFKVPRADQQKVLLFGIALSLLARTGFILLGAALINSFAWVFYLFGLILLVTAGNLLKPEATETAVADNFILRVVRRLFHTTSHYDGDKLFTLHEGKRALTPMLLVMVAIGGTDILFALDSIPAIFGLTQSAFIVFSATAFSLLGLRQLYFLVDGLLERLLYLAYGLALILGFIGVKLILHALHENNLPFVNDGAPVRVIEISTGLSLMVIIAILVVTVVVSLLSSKGKAKTAVTALRRHLAEYLDATDASDSTASESAYARVLASERAVTALAPELRKLIREPQQLREQLARAQRQHEARKSA